MAALLNGMDRLDHKNASRMTFHITRFIDINSPAILACRERLSLIYAQANEQGGLEEPGEVARPEAMPAATEPSRLQRVISPVSVMAPPDPDESTNQCGYSSQKHGSEHQQQHFHSTVDDIMDTDDEVLRW